MFSALGRFGAIFIGWSYIPGILSTQLLIYFHRFYQSVLHRQPPSPGTPEYQRHRKWAYTVVVFGYALYTFWDAATAIKPNYYELLGVYPTADESDLKVGFRNFAKRYHPDRAGPESETYFMHVRTAYDALKNPTTRFAYDRFGEEALRWNKSTIGEYIQHGMWSTALNFVSSVCLLFAWNQIVPRGLAFWNYILLITLWAIELSFIVSSSPSALSTDTSFSYLIFDNPVVQSRSSIFALLWPQRVAYQHIEFLRSFALLLSSALYHVVPNIFPTENQTVNEKTLVEYMSMLQNMTKAINQEALTTIHADLHSCHGEPTGTTPSSAEFANIQPMTPADAVKDRLTAEIQDMVLENVLLSQKGPLRSACEAAVIRKRRSLKTGEKGGGVTGEASQSGDAQPAVPAASSKTADAPSVAVEGRPVSPKKSILQEHMTSDEPPVVLPQAGDVESGHV